MLNEHPPSVWIPSFLQLDIFLALALLMCGFIFSKCTTKSCLTWLAGKKSVIETYKPKVLQCVLYFLNVSVWHDLISISPKDIET